MDYTRRTRKILLDCGVFVEGGHFVYPNGKHGDFYVNKDALYMYPRKFDDVVCMLTETALSQFSSTVDVVLAPSVAGIVLGQGVAYNLSIGEYRNVQFAYADRHPASPRHRIIRRGYATAIPGKNVLLVDDIVDSGTTLVSMADAVVRLGGNPVGAAVICDRGSTHTLRYGLDTEKGVQELTVAALTEWDCQVFSPDDCPLCKAGRPLNTDLGDGSQTSPFTALLKVDPR